MLHLFHDKVDFLEEIPVWFFFKARKRFRAFKKTMQKAFTSSPFIFKLALTGIKELILFKTGF